MLKSILRGNYKTGLLNTLVVLILYANLIPKHNREKDQAAIIPEKAKKETRDIGNFSFFKVLLQILLHLAA